MIEHPRPAAVHSVILSCLKNEGMTVTHQQNRTGGIRLDGNAGTGRNLLHRERLTGNTLLPLAAEHLIPDEGKVFRFAGEGDVAGFDYRQRERSGDELGHFFGSKWGEMGILPAVEENTGVRRSRIEEDRLQIEYFNPALPKLIQKRGKRFGIAPLKFARQLIRIDRRLRRNGDKEKTYPPRLE